MEKILFWRGEIVKEIDKGELFKFLSQKSVKTHLRKTYLGHNVKLNYEDAYDVLLKAMNRTTCIQVYKDNTVRLRLKTDYYETPKSIFLENPHDEITKNMIEEITAFMQTK